MRYDEHMTRVFRADPPGVCALVQDMLPFYLDDDVSVPSRAFIDEHLASCERCASFLAGGRSVQDHLRRDGTLRREVISRDADARAVVLRGQKRLIGRVLVALGMVALIITGYWYGQHVTLQQVSYTMTMSAPTYPEPFTQEAIPTPEVYGEPQPPAAEEAAPLSPVATPAMAEPARFPTPTISQP